MDREGPQQAWPLLHQSRAQDGCLWCLHQRPSGTRHDLDPAEAVRRKDELASQDSANPCLELDRMPYLDTYLETHVLTPTDLSNSERRVPDFYGRYCRRAHFPPDSCHRKSWVHACDEGLMDYISNRVGLCTGFPAQRGLGAILQRCGLHHWNIHQCAHQEEETTSSSKKVPG